MAERSRIQYMKSPAADWPELPQESLCISDSDPEIKRKTAVFTTTTANTTPVSKLIGHFSSWGKLRRPNRMAVEM